MSAHYVGRLDGILDFVDDTSTKTGVLGKTVKRRGSVLVETDQALQVANDLIHRRASTPEISVALIQVLRSAKKAKRLYTEKRRNTNAIKRFFEGDHVKRRLQALKRLTDEAYQTLFSTDLTLNFAFIMYNRNRSKYGSSGNTLKSLEKQYGHERSIYEKNNKAFTFTCQHESLEKAFEEAAEAASSDPSSKSAKTVKKLSKPEKSGGYTLKKSFDQLTDQEVQAIYDLGEVRAHQGGSPTRALFMDRLERLRHLKIVWDGIMVNNDLTPAYSAEYSYRGRFGKESKGRQALWAMDKYGNFYSAPDFNFELAEGGRFERFNHSCFTAGSDVICAGMSYIDINGRLRYLDNGSGHYAPPLANFKLALDILSDEGLDLKGCSITLWTSNGPDGYYAAVPWMLGQKISVPDKQAVTGLNNAY